MILLFLILSIWSHYVSSYSLINCTWPCPNPTDKCTVTPASANCQPSIENSWVINSPRKAPTYTGASVTIENLQCIQAPIPTLPTAQQNDTPPAGYSIINWPIINAKRPQDDYLGNCGHFLYCHALDLTPVCHDRLEYGDTCNSSNQCATNGFCHNHICHPLNETTFDHTHNTETVDSNSSHRETVKIVASIFGIIGAIVFVVAGVLFYRRRKRNNTKKDTVDCVDTEQQFATDFLYDSETHLKTPSPQQQHMQHNINKPPPYEP